MNFTFKMLETPEDRLAAQRLCYEIYVEEMGRFQGQANHSDKLLALKNFEQYRIIGGFDESGHLHAISAMLTGEDVDIPEHYIRDSDLTMFLDWIPKEKLLFSEIILVRSHLRGSSLGINLLMETSNYLHLHDFPALFAECEPHLLQFYLQMGLRPYAKPYFEPNFGMLCPVAFVHDLEYFKECHSPFLKQAHLPSETSELTKELAKLLQQRTSLVGTQQTMTESEWSEVYQQAMRPNAMNASIFSGMTKEQKLSWMKNSVAFTCDKGIPMIYRGNKEDETLYLILSGSVHMQNDKGETLYMLKPGDVVGEESLLLKSQRLVHAVTAEDNTRVLALHPRFIKKRIANHDESAVKFSLNLSRLLCTRMLSPEMTMNQPAQKSMALTSMAS